MSLFPLRRIRWRTITVVALIGVAFGLGFIGFLEYAAAAEQQKTAGDIAYLTIQLFFLESGAVEGAVNLQLQIARFLAPVTTAFALVQAVLTLFAVQAQRMWLWCWGGHVVICGLGRKGARLVEQLRKKGRPVVVIEHDPTNDDLPYCRALGAITLIGSANDEWTLRKSYVHGAESLIAVTGDDGTNIETAVHTHRLNGRRSRKRKPLKCVVHVREPRLRNLFQEHHLYGDPHDPFELELFNVLEVAARSMLREPPVLLPLSGPSNWPPHLLVVGIGRLGEALVRRVLQDWQIDNPASGERLKITVIDACAKDREQQFRLRYPSLAKRAELRFVTMDVHSADFAEGNFDQQDNSESVFTTAYVCLDNDSVAMSTALTLQRLLNDATIPIVVRMSQETGLASLLKSSDDEKLAITGIRPVGLLDLTCQLDAVLGGSVELLAQAIHQGYLYDQLGKGEAYGSSAALVSWETLDEGLKESNRQQAQHVPEKLAIIGCEMVSSIEDETPLIEFTEDEINRLAIDEHSRWTRERQSAGWTLGEPKDSAKKISPYLVSWDELSEDVREIDREFVRRLPANLAKADYEIRRIVGSAECN